MMKSFTLPLVLMAAIDNHASDVEPFISQNNFQLIVEDKNVTGCTELFPQSSDVAACEKARACLEYFVQPVSHEAFATFCSALDSEQANNSTLNNKAKSLGGSKPSSGEVWGFGLLCVTFISLTSVLGVGILPLMSKDFFSNMLSTLIGLAVGSLSGSAVFHLIPSAFRLADIDMYSHHSYLNISMSIWLGIYLFFIIERFLKIFMDAKARSQGHTVGHHGHSHGHARSLDLQITQVDANKDADDKEVEILIPQQKSDYSVATSLTSPLSEMANGGDGLHNEANPDAEESATQNNRNIYEQNQSAIRASFGHVDRPHPATRPTVEGIKSLEGSGSSTVSTVAWMIIFGDGIHNFIDGLSIGAAFSESLLTGISVSIAVMCEEFPHELGDFAVLLNAGMSMKQALLYNFLSACTCYVGLVIGILIGELDMNIYIFGLAGGMFLYISLVDMVPEMNESVETASKRSVKSAVGIFLLQNVGILIGILCLFTLAKFQDDIQIGQ